MSSTISRRRLLKKAAAVGGAALATPGATVASGLRQASPAAAPGRKFRGCVSRGAGAGRTTLQELTLRPIGGRQVVVRTEATNLCYSNVPAVLGVQPTAAPAAVPPPSALAAPSGARRMADLAVI